MDKVLTTGSYGICLFSLDVLCDFLAKERLRSKKLLENFQKKPEQYLATLKHGIWIPIVQINSISYSVKLEGYDASFDNEWVQKLEYDGFNIEVKDSLWISDIGAFLKFDREKFVGNDVISYHTLVGTTLNSAFCYSVPSGKYLVTIKGFARSHKLEHPNPNYGFSFFLTKASEFDGYNNPREDELYDFNVGNM